MTGVSDRSASLIASTVLQEVGLIISNEDTSLVIDRNKRRHEKDKTITQEKRGSSYHRKTITEKHNVLHSEPGSQYISQVAPPSGTARRIKNSIIEFLNIHMVDVSTSVAIGYHEIAVNTSSKNGAIA
nr:unnamed protein product [Callosobruchus analis]